MSVLVLNAHVLWDFGAFRERAPWTTAVAKEEKMDLSYKESALKAFEEKFGDTNGVKCYFAPGRVNLIGEHTDYNGGHVFPCALTIGTYMVVRQRADRKLRFYSENFKYKTTLNLLRRLTCR